MNSGWELVSWNRWNNRVFQCPTFCFFVTDLFGQYSINHSYSQTFSKLHHFAAMLAFCLPHFKITCNLSRTCILQFLCVGKMFYYRKCSILDMSQFCRFYIEWRITICSSFIHFFSYYRFFLRLKLKKLAAVCDSILYGNNGVVFLVSEMVWRIINKPFWGFRFLRHM